MIAVVFTSERKFAAQRMRQIARAARDMCQIAKRSRGARKGRENERVSYYKV